MRSTLALLALLGAATALPAAAGEIRLDRFDSRALGREYLYNVYLPDGYDKSGAAYPVVYLLHGASGNQDDWVAKGGVKETLDGLIQRGQMRPSIAILPGNGTSWWVDGAVDKAETAFVKELVPDVEGKYRVAGGRANRAIGGLSMGGYGSLNLALSYPDLFCAAAIISPAIYDPLPPPTSAARRTPQFVSDGKFSEDLWTSRNYPPRLEKYRAQATRVPMWIVSGDHDRLGIALMSAQLYWKMYQVQKDQVELRVVDGDHEWMVFRDTLPDSLQYVDRQCAKR